MISTDFAPNVDNKSASAGMKILFNPFKWYAEKASFLSKIKLASVLSVDEDKIELTYNGRSAIYHLLKELDLNIGDDVFVTGFTCLAVVLPILNMKLNPRYIDIEERTFSIDMLDFQNKIIKYKKPKILILQHTFGLMPINRDKIIDYCEKNNIFLIEDLAHGFDFQNIKNWSKPKRGAWIFSFGRSKMISCVDGGAYVMLANDKSKSLVNDSFKSLSKVPVGLLIRLIMYNILALTIKTLYDIKLGKILHYLLSKIGLMLPEISSSEKKGKLDKNIFYQFSGAQAYLLNSALDNYLEVMEEKRSNTLIYLRKYPNFDKSNLPWGRYPIRIQNRDEIIATLRKKNIFLGTWYSQPVHSEINKASVFGYEKGECVQAEKICQEIVNLPNLINNPEVLIKEIEDCRR